MRYRPLGQTGMKVSEIGFGCWGIGGATEGATSYGETNDEASKAALQWAFKLGLNFFDTADLYGNGRSERLLGEVFHPVRDRIVLASKVGFLTYGAPQDFSETHIRKSLEGTLHRLQTDYLDLYQLHNPPPEELQSNKTIGRTLEALKKEGLVRFYGISVKSPYDGFTAIREFNFSTIQVNFNLVDQRALDSGLFDLCRSRGVGVIVRTPLCFGFLSGQYHPESQFATNDHRSSWPPEQRSIWANASRHFTSAVIDSASQTRSHIALRYCLSFPAVSTVIPGMLETRQVEENASASELGPFSSAEIANIRQVYQEHSFFLAPRVINYAPISQRP